MTYQILHNIVGCIATPTKRSRTARSTEHRCSKNKAPRHKDERRAFSFWAAGYFFRQTQALVSEGQTQNPIYYTQNAVVANKFTAALGGLLA